MKNKTLFGHSVIRTHGKPNVLQESGKLTVTPCAQQAWTSDY